MPQDVSISMSPATVSDIFILEWEIMTILGNLRQFSFRKSLVICVTQIAGGVLSSVQMFLDLVIYIF